MGSVETFNVDPAAVQLEWFPHIQAFTTTSKPSAEAVSRMIDRGAARLDGAIRVKNLDPGDIADLDSDDPAYLWCQDTILLDAAIRVMRATTGHDPDVVQAQRKELEARYQDLALRGYLALGGGAVALAPEEEADGPWDHIESHSLDTGDASDASDVIPVFRKNDVL